MEDNYEYEKKTILIVDDEQKIVDLLVHNLTREGYNTIEANDGQTAIDLAISQRPDLILLDVMIPRVDGLTVCKKIKNYYNKMSEDTKIILVNILADNLIYLHDFEVVDKEVVKKGERYGQNERAQNSGFGRDKVRGKRIRSGNNGRRERGESDGERPGQNYENARDGRKRRQSLRIRRAGVFFSRFEKSG